MYVIKHSKFGIHRVSNVYRLYYYCDKSWYMFSVFLSLVSDMRGPYNPTTFDMEAYVSTCTADT